MYYIAYYMYSTIPNIVHIMAIYMCPTSQENISYMYKIKFHHFYVSEI